MRLTIILLLVLAWVLIFLGNIQVRTEQKERKVEKKEEKFKVGDVVKNKYGNLLEIVPYREYKKWQLDNRFWNEFTTEYEKTTLYYCKNQKGTFYSTECNKDVTKVTKIEEFIFKNGGK